MKSKRVVVTGGSGFIGSHLVRRLLELGAEVAVTVRYGNIMKNERLRDCWDDVHIIEADLRNRQLRLRLAAEESVSRKRGKRLSAGSMADGARVRGLH